MTITSHAVESAYAKLSIATKELNQANMVVFDMQQQLLSEKHNLIAHGIEGKNQAERDANLFLETEKTFNQLNQEKSRASYKQTQFDLAKLEVKRLELLVRIAELETSA